MEKRLTIDSYTAVRLQRLKPMKRVLFLCLTSAARLCFVLLVSCHSLSFNYLWENSPLVQACVYVCTAGVI